MLVLLSVSFWFLVIRGVLVVIWCVLCGYGFVVTQHFQATVSVLPVVLLFVCFCTILCVLCCTWIDYCAVFCILVGLVGFYWL